MTGSLAPCLYLTSVLTLRSKEFNSIAIWSCQCDPMGIAPADIAVVTKHSDEKRGIEPICQSAWSTDPACGRSENAATKSKQIRARFSAGSWQLKTHAPQLRR
jgi:hypothetical protein